MSKYALTSTPRADQVARRRTYFDRAWQSFSPDTLNEICTLPEEGFAKRFGMVTTAVPQQPGADFYAFKDCGAKILFVAHLDTVVQGADNRRCRFLETAGGTVVYSGALDDRLGAYVGLDLLPRLGITTDVLLTVGEESGQSTALYFDPPTGKDYNWIIEFDRGGTDVVLYNYEDAHTKGLVQDCGARVGMGSFSDISYMEHLGVKAFNWGVGYEDYHSDRSHAWLDDTFGMVAKFMEFYRVNHDTALPHEEYDRRASRVEELDEERLDGLTDAEWSNYRAWWAQVEA